MNTFQSQWTLVKRFWRRKRGLMLNIRIKPWSRSWHKEIFILLYTNLISWAKRNIINLAKKPRKKQNQSKNFNLLRMKLLFTAVVIQILNFRTLYLNNKTCHSDHKVRLKLLGSLKILKKKQQLQHRSIVWKKPITISITGKIPKK